MIFLHRIISLLVIFYHFRNLFQNPQLAHSVSYQYIFSFPLYSLSDSLYASPFSISGKSFSVKPDSFNGSFHNCGSRSLNISKYFFAAVIKAPLFSTPYPKQAFFIMLQRLDCRPVISRCFQILHAFFNVLPHSDPLGIHHPQTIAFIG